MVGQKKNRRLEKSKHWEVQTYLEEKCEKEEENVKMA